MGKIGIKEMLTTILFLPLISFQAYGQKYDLTSKEAQDAYQKYKKQTLMYSKLKDAALRGQCYGGSREQNMACMVIQRDMVDEAVSTNSCQSAFASKKMQDFCLGQKKNDKKVKAVARPSKREREKALLGFDPMSKLPTVALGLDPELKARLDKLKEDDKEKFNRYQKLVKMGECKSLVAKVSEYQACKEFEMFEISRAAVENQCAFYRGVKSQYDYCQRQRKKYETEGVTDAIDADMILSNPDRKKEKIAMFEKKAFDYCKAQGEEEENCFKAMQTKDRRIEFQKKCHTCMKDKDHIEMCMKIYPRDYLRDYEIKIYAYYGQCYKLKKESENDECQKQVNDILMDQISYGCKDMVAGKMYSECINLREKAMTPAKGEKDFDPSQERPKKAGSSRV